MFDRLFHFHKPEPLSVSAPRIPTSLLKQIRAIVGPRGIPSLPGTAQRAFVLSTDPKASTKDYVSLIELDEGLTAKILRTANSAFFSRGEPVHSVEQAVSRIGTTELGGMLSSSCLRDFFPSQHRLRTQLWAHNVATAIIARTLAQRLSPNLSGAAFLAGLVHDIGKLLLLQSVESEYLTILQMVQETGVSFTEAEQDHFLVSHSEVGQFVAEQWKFPTEIVAAIRLHHQPLKMSKGKGNQVHYQLR